MGLSSSRSRARRKRYLPWRTHMRSEGNSRRIYSARSAEVLRRALKVKIDAVVAKSRIKSQSCSAASMISYQGSAKLNYRRTAR